LSINIFYIAGTISVFDNWFNFKITSVTFCYLSFTVKFFLKMIFNKSSNIVNKSVLKYVNLSNSFSLLEVSIRSNVIVIWGITKQKTTKARGIKRNWSLKKDPTKTFSYLSNPKFDDSNCNVTKTLLLSAILNFD